MYKGQNDAHNLDPLPITSAINRVAYRIAYIALCVENSDLGRELLKELREIPRIDGENIQLCCGEWFWKTQPNSYALQVEPDRFKHKDRAILDYREALHVEKTRNQFFMKLHELVDKQKRKISFE